MSQGWFLLLITHRALTHTPKSHLVSGRYPKAVLGANGAFIYPESAGNIS